MNEEREMVRTAIHKYLQPVLLDAIYDDGKVNEVYKNFPDSLVQYFDLLCKPYQKEE